MAFASEMGVYELGEKVLPEIPSDGAEKQWLIGIQDGVTQPNALEKLKSQENSSVRVPFAAAVLADPALRAPDFFHPKLYYFENSSTRQAAIVSTSANLTLGGLTSNVEQVLVWRGDRTDPTAVALSEWWDTHWAEAEPISDAFLSSYEVKRPKPPLRKPPLTAEPADSVLREATRFWIELTRKPEGGSSNQVELLLNGHLFFFPNTSNATKHQVTLEDARGKLHEGRQVTYHSSNGMWRVYMPTPAMGVRDYQDGDVLVRFERTGESALYRFEVAPTSSARALAWIDESTVAEQSAAPPRRMGWA